MASIGPSRGEIIFKVSGEQSLDDEDFIEGIKESIADFSEGRYKIFEDDCELEDYLMAF
jgi:hypothetical protein